MKHRIHWLAGLALAATLPQAAAQLPMAASCTAVATPLAFGDYVPNQAASIDTTSSLRIDCTSPVPQPIAYVISISPGMSGNAANRTLMRGAGGTLPYNLYTDANRTIVWGDGTGGTMVVTGTITPPGELSGTVPVYGRLPGLQFARPGSYSDLLIVTVTY